MSHVAFLTVFRLLSGSGVASSTIKQTPKTPREAANETREVEQRDKNIHMTKLMEDNIVFYSLDIQLNYPICNA